jgi:hypothetical protein
VPVFQRLQKRGYHIRFFHEPMDRLKAYHPIVSVKQDAGTHDRHHERVAMQYGDRLTPTAGLIVLVQQQIVQSVGRSKREYAPGRDGDEPLCIVQNECGFSFCIRHF